MYNLTQLKIKVRRFILITYIIYNSFSYYNISNILRLKYLEILPSISMLTF
ncbi:hypothetical protein HMPREF9129_0405 [Peptoniphilus indolicus ATCC 29427]|uniref:Uncharacterized protein n=1 Tax=Peptoniphilus indolicus ATCC 29427 TaxID=997350 RepID=G4D1X5_9FIRM|nr:hypothetical protein HMPREF9129_0405 [Peptoniphilus indolicus ATCC 29427]